MIQIQWSDGVTLRITLEMRREGDLRCSAKNLREADTALI